MIPGEVAEVVLTALAVLVPWTTLMISAETTETAIILLEEPEEGKPRIEWLIIYSNLNI